MKLNLLLPSSPGFLPVSMKFSAMAAASNLFSSLCDLFLIVCFLVVDGLFIYLVIVSLLPLILSQKLRYLV
jgi:hypothetical protein